MDNQKARLLIARRQLGTALWLFGHDRDSVSVHTLASAAAQLVAHSVRSVGEEPWSFYIEKSNPQLTRREIRATFSAFDRHFKHATTHKENAELETANHLSQFHDRLNGYALWAAWYDYMLAAKKLPIPAQVFQIWWAEKTVEGHGLHMPFEEFRGLRDFEPEEQKRRLRLITEKALLDEELRQFPGTDLDPLIMDAIHIPIDSD